MSWLPSYFISLATEITVIYRPLHSYPHGSPGPHTSCLCHCNNPNFPPYCQTPTSYPLLDADTTRISSLSNKFEDSELIINSLQISTPQLYQLTFATSFCARIHSPKPPYHPFPSISTFWAKLIFFHLYAFAPANSSSWNAPLFSPFLVKILIPWASPPPRIFSQSDQMKSVTF